MQIDDSKYGSRNKRGDWKPYKLSSNIPFFDWPFSITKNLKWLLGIPGYIVPWTFFYGLIEVASENELKRSLIIKEIKIEEITYNVFKYWGCC